MSKNKVRKAADGKIRRIKPSPETASILQSLKKFRFILLSIALIFSGILIFSNTLHVPFYFDDYDSIIENPAIKNLSYFSRYNGIYDLMHTRYLSYLTFALNFHFSGMDVSGYHMVNIAIHLLCSIMVMLLIRQILNSYKLKDSLTEDDKFLIAVTGSFLFLIHPAQTQAVTYIVQRMTSLASLFYISSLFFYLLGRNKYYNSSTSGQKFFTIPIFFVSITSFFLSLFSKEIAVTLPIMYLLCELLLIRNGKQKISWGVVATISAFILAAFLLVIMKYGLPIEADSIPRQVYLFTQIDVMFTYFRLLFLPIIQNIDYDFPLRISLLDPELLIKLILILMLLYYAVRLIKKERLIAFGIFWFFISISVESSIIPIRDVINEHRLYLPMFGFGLIISALFIKLRGKISNPGSINTVSVILALVLSILAYNRNGLWNDPGKMWSDVISKSPQKDRPYLARGSFYLRENMADAAIADLLKVIELNKKEFRAYDNLGYAYQSKNLYDKAIQYHNIAIQMNPGSALSYNNRGVCLLYLKQWDKAIPDFEKAVNLNRDYTDAYFNLGYVYYRQQEYGKSNLYFTQALKINPSYTDIYPYLIMGNYRLGNVEQAKTLYSEMKNLGIAIPKSIRDVMNDK